MNDRDRWEWISNEAGLYSWWRSSRQSMTAFIKTHRKEIDAAVEAYKERHKPVDDWRKYAR